MKQEVDSKDKVMHIEIVYNITFCYRIIIKICYFATTVYKLIDFARFLADDGNIASPDNNT